ncbi:family 43 glycosylhydrolase [Leifsonia flava]|uniref:Beta-xylosidase n=1 Tax=Orlajensenia leifsoniae TaxID=2561933 RepID=A0A4Y9R960_9MICO|nr:family 43 glycosylhydrolase [Leifsonia flava]TFV99916.1 hypothetical protein E4M00_01555 [Leifsonia flava]
MAGELPPVRRPLLFLCPPKQRSFTVMPTRRTTTILLAAATTIAVVLGVGTPVYAAAPYPNVANDTVWQDAAGTPIKAQGGNVLKVGATYYWVGTGMDKSPDPANPLPKSVNLYSSSDLENWAFVKSLVTQSGTGDFAAGKWLGRPQLVLNPNTGQFILTVELGGGRVNSAQKSLGNAVGFFTSASIDGDYSFHGKQYPDGLTRGDGSIFVDGDNAYMVYVGDSAESRNVSINVAPLSSDWLTLQPHFWTDTNSNHNEAPAIVKIGAKYYLFASGMNYWAGTPTSYRTSTDLLDWSAWSTMSTEPASNTSFGTQFEQIIPVTGTAGTSYLYNGDRYSQFYAPTADPAPGGIGRNAWYPVTFSATGVPTLHGNTDVSVDAPAGTLAVNEVANGRFDQDLPGTFIPQWTATGTNGAAKVENTTTPGNRQLTLWNAATYNTWVAQSVTLPNGTYTVSFDYKSSGGQNNAYFSVKNHGSAEIQTPLTAQSSWTAKTVTFTVTTGSVRIGFWSDGPGGKWTNVDNVSIWKN